MVGRVWAACDAGNTSVNECTYGDATGITHGGCNARSHVHCNTDTSADLDCCAAHGGAKCDVHGDA